MKKRAHGLLVVPLILLLLVVGVICIKVVLANNGSPLIPWTSIQDFTKTSTQNNPPDTKFNTIIPWSAIKSQITTATQTIPSATVNINTLLPWSSIKNTPRELTPKEQTLLTDIALQTDEVKTWLQKKIPYRIQTVWIFNDGNGWYPSSYPIVNPDTTLQWYPGVKIGLGSPQVQVITIAMDITTARIIHISSYPDGPNHLTGLQYLNSVEKTRLMGIASTAAGITSLNDYSMKFAWVGYQDSGRWTFDYDIVEIGIPEYSQWQTFKFYPAIIFQTGFGYTGVTMVIIDPTSEKVIDVVQGAPAPGP